MWPTLGTALQALQTSIPAVTELVTASCYLIGFWFVWRALYRLKIYGEMRTMMSSHSDLRGPIALILAATVLIYIPTSIGVFENTLFGTYTPSPLHYTSDNPGASQLWQISIIIFRLFGLVGFVRGWIIVGNLGGQGGPGNTMTKALMHIMGGALAMNIEGTVHVLASTFGFA